MIIQHHPTVKLRFFLEKWQGRFLIFLLLFSISNTMKTGTRPLASLISRMFCSNQHVSWPLPHINMLIFSLQIEILCCICHGIKYQYFLGKNGKNTSTLGLIPSPNMHMVVKQIGVLSYSTHGMWDVSKSTLGASQFAGVFEEKCLGGM